MVSILDCCRLSVNPGMPGELPPGFRAGQQAFRTDCCRSRGDGGETERQRIDPGGRSCVRGSGPGMERVMTIT